MFCGVRRVGEEQGDGAVSVNRMSRLWSPRLHRTTTNLSRARLPRATLKAYQGITSGDDALRRRHLTKPKAATAKELVARQIHELSRRRRAPFVAVNCAAIVETLLEAELFGIEDRTATGVRGRRGKFEHAHEGTLFLDEVSDLSAAAQAKLLRAIQDLSVERVGGYGARGASTPASSSRRTGRCSISSSRSASAWTSSTV